ncbi:hypothetical protein A2U01_0079635 [Trifolium medium]|uniref:Uncharacterized protein n=1 Tax=Trifolium medium TaxID=97028 RepID=A0A392TDS7_9FABA|nr:hypothetical protein [Trifolium medium]
MFPMTYFIGNFNNSCSVGSNADFKCGVGVTAQGSILGSPDTATSHSTIEGGGEDREVAMPGPPKMGPWAVTVSSW